jgi:hypothetical protein
MRPKTKLHAEYRADCMRAGAATNAAQTTPASQTGTGDHSERVTQRRQVFSDFVRQSG